MNKLLKKFRKLGYNDVEYIEGSPPKYVLIDYQWQKIFKGVPRRLHPDCGRAKYQKLKRAFKNG